MNSLCSAKQKHSVAEFDSVEQEHMRNKNRRESDRVGQRKREREQ